MYEVYHVSQCGKHGKRGHALYLLIICFFSHKKISLHSLREKIRIRIGTPCVHIFSHPDFTVGAGISPARLLRVRGLYHRYGISPIPKDSLSLDFCQKLSFEKVSDTFKELENVFDSSLTKVLFFNEDSEASEVQIRRTLRPDEFEFKSKLRRLNL